MTDKSTNELLKQIHKKLAEDMLNRLKDGELSSAEWTSIAHFLKGNNITADPDNSDELDSLRREMEEKRKRRGLSNDEKTDLENVIKFKKG